MRVDTAGRTATPRRAVLSVCRFARRAAEKGPGFIPAVVAALLCVHFSHEATEHRGRRDLISRTSLDLLEVSPVARPCVSDAGDAAGDRRHARPRRRRVPASEPEGTPAQCRELRPAHVAEGRLGPSERRRDHHLAADGGDGSRAVRRRREDLDLRRGRRGALRRRGPVRRPRRRGGAGLAGAAAHREARRGLLALRLRRQRHAIRGGQGVRGRPQQHGRHRARHGAHVVAGRRLRRLGAGGARVRQPCSPRRARPEPSNARRARAPARRAPLAPGPRRPPPWHRRAPRSRSCYRPSRWSRCWPSRRRGSRATGEL